MTPAELEVDTVLRRIEDAVWSRKAEHRKAIAAGEGARNGEYDEDDWVLDLLGQIRAERR